MFVTLKNGGTPVAALRSGQLAALELPMMGMASAVVSNIYKSCDI